LYTSDHRKILYLVNPISGTGDKRKIEKIIVRQTQAKNIHFEIRYTTQDGAYEFLPRKIEEENITDVVICGGDGTINQVCSHLQNCTVNVGIIPVGSGNGLATAAGISRNIKKSLEIVFQNKTKRIDAFTLNGKFGCMLAGLGFDARVAFAFSKEKRRGLMGYINICFQEFFKKLSYRIKVKIDGKTLEEEIFFISMANSNQFGNRVTIAPEASLSDGLLDVVLVTKMNPFLSGMYLLLQILSGRIQKPDVEQNKKKKIYYWQTSELEIENPDLAPLHIDGEPKTTSEHIKIKLISKAIDLLVP
jgi:YegS/Rv2252/BmrU family lipid kinase